MKDSTSHLTDLDGVARFVDGGDIIYDPQMPNGMIKMSGHRKGFGRPINGKNDDPVLHRLVLSSHERKLNEFVTFYSTHARSQEDEQWCAQ